MHRGQQHLSRVGQAAAERHALFGLSICFDVLFMVGNQDIISTKTAAVTTDQGSRLSRLFPWYAF